MLRIAFWWGIPCKSIIPVCRELAEFENIEVGFYSESELPEFRKKLGWNVPALGKLKYKVLNEVGWKNEIKNLLKTDYDLHIFNGVYLYKKLRYALDLAIKLNLKIGVITEAPHNPYFGFAGLLKSVFTKTITPYRVRSRAKKISFLLSASGNEVNKFVKLGWEKDKIFPFGYFPENDLSGQQKQFKEPISLLCTGFLTKNKGHALLIKALKIIKDDGIKFICKITGYGPEYKKLYRLINKLNLEREVKLLGVVSDKELDELKLKSHLFIAPGFEEPWGIRINEAILAALPIIVSDKIGASELVKVGKTGVIFKSGDYRSLAANLKILLSDSNKIKALHQNCLIYRKKILPKEAAKYLNEVINYQLNLSESKPKFPLWLS